MVAPDPYMEIQTGLTGVEVVCRIIEIVNRRLPRNYYRLSFMVAKIRLTCSAIANLSELFWII